MAPGASTSVNRSLHVSTKRLMQHSPSSRIQEQHETQQMKLPGGEHEVTLEHTCRETAGFLPFLFLPTWKVGLTGAGAGDRLRCSFRSLWLPSTDSLLLLPLLQSNRKYIGHCCITLQNLQGLNIESTLQQEQSLATPCVIRMAAHERVKTSGDSRKTTSCSHLTPAAL